MGNFSGVALQFLFLLFMRAAKNMTKQGIPERVLPDASFLWRKVSIILNLSVVLKMRKQPMKNAGPFKLETSSGGIMLENLIY